jgi:Glycosyl hydrolases family 39
MLMAVRNGLLDSYDDAFHERTSPGEMPGYWYSPHGECAAEWKTTRPLLSKVVGARRANEGLRATWQEELQTAHDEAGFQYVRFHGIFHDDISKCDKARVEPQNEVGYR